MSSVTVNDGRVCIVKVAGSASSREGLEKLKATISELTADIKASKNENAFIFVDLSPFTVINSSLIGAFGAIVMEQKIKLLGLCGVQHSVLDILKRFGVITVGNASSEANVKTFSTIKDGLITLAD